jgi:uroporphyrinogen III methyltransferase/synthase
MRYACIGPVTAESALDAGLGVALVAEVYTTEGLIDALVRYFNKENNNDG